MNAALALRQGIGATNIGGLLAFTTPLPERSTKRLSASAGDLLGNIASVLDELVLRAIERRTASEFSATVNEVFPKYFSAARALSDLVRIVVPHDVIERVVAESFSELEADFRDQGSAAFGSDMRNQAIFTIWTLRKIADFSEEINSIRLPEDLKEADSKLSADFVLYAVWTRFHLDCLTRSMHLGRPIYPEVLDEVPDGLRAAVNAYALIRRGLDLRAPASDPAIPPVEWDDEEQELLDSATYDTVSDSSDDGSPTG